MRHELEVEAGLYLIDGREQGQTTDDQEQGLCGRCTIESWRGNQRGGRSSESNVRVEQQRRRGRNKEKARSVKRLASKQQARRGRAVEGWSSRGWSSRGWSSKGEGTARVKRTQDRVTFDMRAKGAREGE